MLAIYTTKTYNSPISRVLFIGPEVMLGQVLPRLGYLYYCQQYIPFHNVVAECHHGVFGRLIKLPR